MFITNFGPSMNFAFPCVNKIVTPIGLIPIPLFNLSMNCFSVPTVFNIFVGGLPAHNILTVTPFSNGSEIAAPTGGLISNMFCSATRNVFGSFKVFYGGAPVTRWLDPTVQNGFIPNSVGATLTMTNLKQMALT